MISVMPFTFWLCQNNSMYNIHDSWMFIIKNEHVFLNHKINNTVKPYQKTTLISDQLIIKTTYWFHVLLYNNTLLNDHSNKDHLIIKTSYSQIRFLLHNEATPVLEPTFFRPTGGLINVILHTLCHSKNRGPKLIQQLCI